jgi:hypothetical protein
MDLLTGPSESAILQRIVLFRSEQMRYHRSRSRSRFRRSRLQLSLRNVRGDL